MYLLWDLIVSVVW